MSLNSEGRASSEHNAYREQCHWPDLPAPFSCRIRSVLQVALFRRFPLGLAMWFLPPVFLFVMRLRNSSYARSILILSEADLLPALQFGLDSDRRIMGHSKYYRLLPLQGSSVRSTSGNDIRRRSPSYSPIRRRRS